MNAVKWKTPIHGRAWSSPVIWGNQVWMSTATEEGRELFAVCVDRESGKVTQDLKLFDVEKPQFAHQFNSYASPTPVLEAGRGEVLRDQDQNAVHGSDGKDTTREVHSSLP
jgi:hypothetical protein